MNSMKPLKVSSRLTATLEALFAPNTSCLLTHHVSSSISGLQLPFLAYLNK